MSRRLCQSCPGSPQIPPVPYDRSVSRSSTSPLPPEDPLYRSPPILGAQSCAAQPGLLSLQLAREARNSAPTHRLIFPPSRRSPPAPPPALSPRLPPTLPSAPTPGPSRRRRPSRSGPATLDSPCAVSAPLLARAAAASSPPPTLGRANGRRPTRRRGRQRPRGPAGRLETGEAPSSPPAAAPSSPGGSARPGVRGERDEARCGHPAAGCGPPRAAVVGSAPLGPAPRPPSSAPRRAPRVARSSEVGEGAGQLAVGAFTAAGRVWPHRRAPASRSRVYSGGGDCVAGFPKELEEGREGARPPAKISSPSGEVSTGKLLVTAPPPNNSPAGRYLMRQRSSSAKLLGHRLS